MTAHRRGPRGQAVPYPSTTSTNLLRGVGDHDESAWRRLENAYAPLILWCARRRGFQGEDAADVVQQVWLLIRCGFHTFRRNRQGPCFRPWVWTLADRCCIDMIRQRKGRADQAIGGDGNDAWLQTIPAKEGQADIDMPPAMDESLHRKLELIRSEFSNATWTAFWERTIKERPAADIAEDLNMTVAAVHTAKSRVLKRLREQLGEDPR